MSAILGTWAVFTVFAVFGALLSSSYPTGQASRTSRGCRVGAERALSIVHVRAMYLRPLEAVLPRCLDRDGTAPIEL
jgi:hypothetical protein